jgi:hypothetical protein
LGIVSIGQPVKGSEVTLTSLNVDNAVWSDLICFHGPGNWANILQAFLTGFKLFLHGNAERVDKLDDK